MVSKKDKFLAAAQKYLERGQPEKALVELGRVVQEDPKDTRTWLKMAEIHAKRGAIDDATQIYFKTADLYTEQGFFQKAVAVYKNVLKLNPGLVQGHFKLADLFKQLGLLQDAMNQLEVAAAVLQKAKRQADALDALRKMVEIQPDNVVSRIKLAEAAVQAGVVDEAIREFALAAEQLRSEGRADEYLKVAERLLFYQPENLPLARELAEAYIARNNARFALPKLQACFKLDPRDAATLALLAKAFEQLGQVPKTISVLKELARLCHEQGRQSERNEALRKVMALDPNDVDARQMAHRFGLAGFGPRSAETAGAPAGAGGAAPEVRRPATGGGPAARRPSGRSGPEAIPERPGGGEPPSGDSGPPEVQRIITEAEFFVKYGLLERAADHLRRVFELDGKNVGAREKLVAVHVQLGRISEAVAELETVAEQLATTRPEDAAEFARRALALDPRSARARTLLEAIESGGPAPAQQDEDLVSEPEMRVEMPPPAPEPEVEASEPAIEIEDSSPLIQVVTPAGTVISEDDEASLVDAAEALPPGEFAEAQRTASGDFLLDDKTPAGEFAEGPASGDLVDLERGRTVFTDAAAALGGGQPGALPPADADLVAEIEQVDFFVGQGLPEHARALLLDLDGRFPGNAVVADKLARVQAAIARSAGSGPEAAGLEGAVSKEPAEQSRGGDADLATHKDLGIAYQQMGDHDAAILEFQLLAQDPREELFALQMIGECQEAKGSLPDAVIHYKKALNHPRVGVEQATLLYYLLGNVYDRLDDAKEALYYFEKVLKRDPSFRDVHGRITALRTWLGGPANGHGPKAAKAVDEPAFDEFDAAFESLLVDGSRPPKR